MWTTAKLFLSSSNNTSCCSCAQAYTRERFLFLISIRGEWRRSRKKENKSTEEKVESKSSKVIITFLYGHIWVLVLDLTSTSGPWLLCWRWWWWWFNTSNQFTQLPIDFETQQKKFCSLWRFGGRRKKRSEKIADQITAQHSTSRLIMIMIFFTSLRSLESFLLLLSSSIFVSRRKKNSFNTIWMDKKFHDLFESEKNPLDCFDYSPSRDLFFIWFFWSAPL